MKYFGSISLLVACFAFLSSSNVLVHGMPDAATTSASTPTASKESHSHTGNVIHDMLHGTSKSDTGKKDIINAMATHSTFAGTLKPVLKKLRLNKEEGVVLLNSLSKSVHWEDLVLILTVGWLSVPFLEIPYSKLPAQDHPPFRHTYLYMAADHLQQGARIALAVYAVDVIKMFCVGVGLDFCSMGHFPHAFAQTAYVVWLAVSYLDDDPLSGEEAARLSLYKSQFLSCLTYCLTESRRVLEKIFTAPLRQPPSRYLWACSDC
jgi:hypothetical protein